MNSPVIRHKNHFEYFFSAFFCDGVNLDLIATNLDDNCSIFIQSKMITNFYYYNTSKRFHFPRCLFSFEGLKLFEYCLHFNKISYYKLVPMIKGYYLSAAVSGNRATYVTHVFIYDHIRKMKIKFKRY